jgi:hypothetical protein
MTAQCYLLGNILPSAIEIGGVLWILYHQLLDRALQCSLEQGDVYPFDLLHGKPK